MERAYMLTNTEDVTQGRKLEEMDDLFKHAGWFVPTQNYEVISATQRENELRAGKSGIS